MEEQLPEGAPKSPIEKLTYTEVRSMWAHEERGFTVWLEQNLDTLAEQLGLTLEAVHREGTVGSFRVDLVADDGSGNLVIIENQLEQTDHDHLGKLLTYLANTGAKAAIWVTSDPRPEHVAAVGWLNASTTGAFEFYLVQVQGIRIGNSQPAPLFTPIVRPSVEVKALGATQHELEERHIERMEFWGALLERAAERGLRSHQNRKPSPDNWLDAGAGEAGLAWAFIIRMHDARVEFWIGKPDREQNELIFNRLLAQREQIEQAFGASLQWDHDPGRIKAALRSEISRGGLSNRDDWTAVQDEMIDRMKRLIAAVTPHLS